MLQVCASACTHVCHMLQALRARSTVALNGLRWQGGLASRMDGCDIANTGGGMWPNYVGHVVCCCGQAVLSDCIFCYQDMRLVGCFWWGPRGGCSWSAGTDIP